MPPISDLTPSTRPRGFSRGASPSSAHGNEEGWSAELGSNFKPATENETDPRKSKPRFARVMPEVWKLVRPIRWLLASSLVLMIVNRVCGLAMPIASRYLINDVMYKQDFEKLYLIVGAVIGATCIQAITTFILNQQLSITGQRLIADLRMKVQQHVGRLPVSFYDSNRAGAIASRIMNDVEGVRNLVGAGFIDFVGGILTSIIALIILMRISSLMTILTFCILIAFGLFLRKVFAVTRPIFRERSRITAERSE